MTIVTPVTSTVNPRRPFGLGLAPGTRLIRSWTVGSLAFDLVEDADAPYRNGGYPYALHATCGGRSEAYGLDTLPEVVAMADHLSRPLPSPETTVNTFPNRLLTGSVACARGMAAAWEMPGETEDE